MNAKNNETAAKSPVNVRSMTLIALMTAVCAIISPFSVPIGPVPVSLSILAVLLNVYVLGTRDSLISISLYILLGLVGLPVFSGFSGGAAKLFGPTGGYILGYLPLVFITGAFLGRFRRKHIFMQIIGMILGLSVCYAFGTLWFVFLMKVSVSEALAMCVYPFIVFDLLKIACAFFAGNTLIRLLPEG